MMFHDECICSAVALEVDGQKAAALAMKLMVLAVESGRTAGMPVAGGAAGEFVNAGFGVD